MPIVNVLEFPTNPFSYIYLFQNNKLLTAREESATLVTAPFNTWDISVASDFVLSVDGTPAQDQTFNVTDFGIGASFSGLPILTPQSIYYTTANASGTTTYGAVATSYTI